MQLCQTILCIQTCTQTHVSSPWRIGCESKREQLFKKHGYKDHDPSHPHEGSRPWPPLRQTLQQAPNNSSSRSNEQRRRRSSKQWSSSSWFLPVQHFASYTSQQASIMQRVCQSSFSKAEQLLLVMCPLVRCPGHYPAGCTEVAVHSQLLQQHLQLSSRSAAATALHQPHNNSSAQVAGDEMQYAVTA